MTYPLLFYLPVGRLWARNEPDCSSQDKRINSSKGVGSRRRLSALGLRRDPRGSVKQIHHEELEDGDKERPSAFPKIMLKQTDSGIQQLHGILQHRLKIGIHQRVGNIGYDDGVHKIAGSPNPILRKHIHVAAAQEIADELVKLRDPVLVRRPGPVSQVNGIHLLLDAAAAASPMDHGACVRHK